MRRTLVTSAQRIRRAVATAAPGPVEWLLLTVGLLAVLSSLVAAIPPFVAYLPGDGTVGRALAEYAGVAAPVVY